MRELGRARVYVSDYHRNAAEALLEVATWLVLQNERTLTVITIEIDMTDGADYYATIVVE